MYIPPRVRTPTVVLALGVSLAAGRTAAAAGEHEWQAALRLGAGTVSVDGRKPWGLAAGIDVEYGLTDAWALRLSFEGSTHDVSKANDMDTRPEGTIRTDAALMGLTYTFDVLRLVPYAEVQAGFAQVRGAVVTPQSLLAMQLGVGADYFVTRRVTGRDQLPLPVRAGRPAVRSAEPGDEPVLVHRDRARFVSLLNAAAAAAPPRFFWACARNTSRTGVPSKP